MKLKNSLIFALILSLNIFTSSGEEIKKINKIVILGNSIVSHPVWPSIGWYNNWGMAASAQDSDFVHRMITKIHSVDSLVNIRYENIAEFERSYETYDINKLSSYRNADILIMKLSENVSASTAISRDFNHYYDILVKYLAPSESTTTIVCAGFWPSTVNDILKTYSETNNYPFVSLSDLFTDKSNSAQGLFENAGVAVHPSDKGMKNISNRILSKISIFFPNNKWDFSSTTAVKLANVKMDLIVDRGALSFTTTQPSQYYSIFSMCGEKIEGGQITPLEWIKIPKRGAYLVHLYDRNSKSKITYKILF